MMWQEYLGVFYLRDASSAQSVARYYPNTRQVFINLKGDANYRVVVYELSLTHDEVMSDIKSLFSDA
jgi:hypothetical protein